MPDPDYQAVVNETFQQKPLRTVLMIDDEFPTFSDLARGSTEETKTRFRQQDRAVRLYDSFRKGRMICDVENIASDVHVERFRRSDLIILDYHLMPGEQSSDKSIEILRQLSSSKHFNTIVVYTSETNLDGVWLDIIASLSGGWTTLPADLQGEAQIQWDRLSNAQTLPEASKNAVVAYAKGRSMKAIPTAVYMAARQELIDLGVPEAQTREILEAMIHKALAGMSGRYAGEPVRRAVGNIDGEKRWIQSGNAFVTVLKKMDLTDDDADPAGIMANLSDALLAWRPNLIQILVSEIQNILELEALVADDDHLRDPVTHTALSYYFLEALGPIDTAANPDVRAPLMSLIDKIVEGLRRRLSSDPELLAVGRRALLGELKDAGWTVATWPASRQMGMFDGARTIARTEKLAQVQDTMFRLNSFLSTERFRRAHITTGTIFRVAGSDEYFVATSPSCDLVARQPAKDQLWSHAIFPVTPLMAVRLFLENNIASALSRAADGLHIFLEDGHDRKTFRTVTGSGNQPSYELFMVKNKGLVRDHQGKTIFDATRLAPMPDPAGGEGAVSANQRDWNDLEFEVVAQLRGLNATRLLLATGQHLSRVGLDFMNTPSGQNGQA